MKYQTGTLVEFRSRPWVVQQSSEPQLLVLKPLGGTDAETIGLYKPLYGNHLDEAVHSYSFRKPTADDIGRYSYPSAARLLYNACRLSFRDIAGPFRCLGRLSFDPRPYQMVPLIMALRQDPVRLLIADDVGIGKTLEALLIAKELLDRKEISRFAVICLPHLCEQWRDEIRNKFGLEAEIIRSSTISRLEKNMRANQNVFRDIPFQVISIDYIKLSDRKHLFVEHCPELIIVDEAHTCAKPKGVNKSQQQRHALLDGLARTKRHLVMLTATPHSGNEEEFQSLIGLLKPEFAGYTLNDEKQRRELADHFIQRRRGDVTPYVGDDIIFPKRVPFNVRYKLSDKYLSLLNDIVDYARNEVRAATDTTGKIKRRYVYWDLLALIRGVMSSPDAGIQMLQNKIDKRDSDSEGVADDDNKTYIFSRRLKDEFSGDDEIPQSYEQASNNDKKKFRAFIKVLEEIKRTGDDDKVKRTADDVKTALDRNYNPIIFCHYIQTAEYCKEYIQSHIDTKYKDIPIDVVTSRLPDEDRRMRIEELAKSPRHILVCTDCLSEGVNLQNGFDCVFHYDLPWNPNRLEQRNGRIDRFGQTKDEVAIFSVFDEENNPVDRVVMNVLYQKQEEIRKRLGIYIPIADDDASVMESIMEHLIVLNPKKENVRQASLFDYEDFAGCAKERDERMDRAVEMDKKSHSVFAHNTKDLSPDQLIELLEEARKVTGDVNDTRDFVVDVLRHANVQVSEAKGLPLCYSFNYLSLPGNLKDYFRRVVDRKNIVRVSFASPTPKGYMYIGRNHPFVEDLSRGVVNDSINGGDLGACRAMVMQTNMVDTVTTVMLMRVRSVISEEKHSDNQLVGEEMLFLGFKGNVDRHDFITDGQCRELFLKSEAAGNTDIIYQTNIFDRQLRWTNDEETLRQHTDEFALERAEELVNSFLRFRNYMSDKKKYKVVKPVLPMDVIAAFVYTPVLNN